uniref:peptidylprolyl isomerase n=1 Tax=Noctiluca scintillans TaxID=2966 RepID=A0A7S1F0W2_NOCSC
MSVLDQIKQAEEFKEAGNGQFKEGNYKRALASYHKVFLYVNGLQISSERSALPEESRSTNVVPKDRVEDVKRLKLTTNLNMAACYLKLDDHQKCVDTCGKVLEAGANSKAFFRRGQAYAAMKNVEGARNDFQRARELAPDDPAINAELRRLKSVAAQVDEKEKKTFGGMFDRMKHDKEDSHECDECPRIEEIEETEEVQADEAKPEPKARTIDTDALDDARKPEQAVRPLVYSHTQSEEEVKIYVSFDQHDELIDGVAASRVSCEFGEWSFFLQIQASEPDQAPFGLRLGDFFRRVDPKLCKFAVRSSRITLTFVKREKEHWFNLLQRQG